MTDERLDFSSLDPARDPARFERMVQRVLAGVAAPPPAHPLAWELVRWGRASLAAAALAAAVAWVPSLLGRHASEPAAGGDAVTLVSAWAEAGSVPEGVDVVQALGVIDGR